MSQQIREHPRIYTVGHSTRSLEELVGLLQAHEIEVLADVRSFPSSGRYPHFNMNVLAQRLPETGIAYRWLGQALGGLRKQKDPNSPHTALRSPGFRAYADHMASKEFLQGIKDLSDLALCKRTAVMCAERLWWRCHRSLLSDCLAACCGFEIAHIVDMGKIELHRLHPTARLAEGRLVYDVEGEKA